MQIVLVFLQTLLFWILRFIFVRHGKASYSFREDQVFLHNMQIVCVIWPIFARNQDLWRQIVLVRLQTDLFWVSRCLFEAKMFNISWFQWIYFHRHLSTCFQFFSSMGIVLMFWWTLNAYGIGVLLHVCQKSRLLDTYCIDIFWNRIILHCMTHILLTFCIAWHIACTLYRCLLHSHYEPRFVDVYCMGGDHAVQMVWVLWFTFLINHDSW